MEAIAYENSYSYTISDTSDPKAVTCLENLKKIHQAFYDGTLYVRFISGDREGSIAKVVPDPTPKQDRSREPEWRIVHNSFRGGPNYIMNNQYFWGLCKWDDRRNNPKISLPHRDVEILIGYEGPTVWAKFDAAAAKAEVLKNPDQHDIDGNVLAVGDRVMYINARYGSGMGLERGTIKEFKVVVNSENTSISTVIVGETGVESKISYPRTMVCKIG